MKIVIDIDEQIITDLRSGYARLSEIADAVKNGTVLPKGHGRLIDADTLRAKYQAILDRGDMFCEYDIIGMLDNTPTVEPTLSDEQIEKITDLLETEWGYEGIREDVTRILKRMSDKEPTEKQIWAVNLILANSDYDKPEYTSKAYWNFISAHKEEYMKLKSENASADWDMTAHCCCDIFDGFDGFGDLC